MDNFITGLPSFVSIYIIAAALLIIFFQFLKLRKFKKLFDDLSAVYSKDRKLNYIALVDKIIRSRELYKPGPSSALIDLISNYLKELFNDSKVFIHVTNEKAIAERILTEGFKYSEDFHKSTEEISPNLFDLTYKLHLYKYYGQYVIIIGLPKHLFQSEQNKRPNGNKDFLAESGISEYNPGNELSYKLPSCYVRGYVDIEKLQIVDNDFFQIDNQKF